MTRIIAGQAVPGCRSGRPRPAAAGAMAPHHRELSKVILRGREEDGCGESPQPALESGCAPRTLARARERPYPRIARMTRMHSVASPLALAFLQGEVARMLELRPTCENCNKALPPDSLEARICSFECTFCAGCVEGVLLNVCPNCGGGFVPRPIRPNTNWRDDNFLGASPASEVVRHRPVDLSAHAQFAGKVRGIAPEQR